MEITPLIIKSCRNIKLSWSRKCGNNPEQFLFKSGVCKYVFLKCIMEKSTKNSQVPALNCRSIVDSREISFQIILSLLGFSSIICFYFFPFLSLCVCVYWFSFCLGDIKSKKWTHTNIRNIYLHIIHTQKYIHR